MFIKKWLKVEKKRDKRLFRSIKKSQFWRETASRVWFVEPGDFCFDRYEQYITGHPMIGGELDYWGEGTEFCTIGEHLAQLMRWDFTEYNETDFSCEYKGDKITFKSLLAWVESKAKQ